MPIVIESCVLVDFIIFIVYNLVLMTQEGKEDDIEDVENCQLFKMIELKVFIKFLQKFIQVSFLRFTFNFINCRAMLYYHFIIDQINFYDFTLLQLQLIIVFFPIVQSQEAQVTSTFQGVYF